jgi:hypothetical protein
MKLHIEVDTEIMTVNLDVPPFKSVIDEFLHSEARDLMDELDEKYGMRNMLSLDEYYITHLKKLKKFDRGQILLLLDLFDHNC